MPVIDQHDPPADQAEAVFVSTKETARLLGVSRQHVYDLLDERAIESRYIGRRRLVVMASLRMFIAGLPAERAE
jgi:excisionase family DNA binding protein